MEYEHWYLANVVLMGGLLAYFFYEALQGFRIQKRNIVFLVANSLILFILINEFKKIFWDGIGRWGVHPEANREIMNWLQFFPSLTTFLLLSVIIAGITFLIAAFRTIKFIRR